MTTDYVTITTTTDNDDEAARLSTDAVTARLAACAQVGTIASTYWWNGKVETAKEHRIDYKTTAALADRLTEWIKEAHSYDTPEVIVTPIIGGNAAYLAWVGAETTD
ncbi:MAG TPA: divalent-cation tolerance protein CutA [Actinospica sp.]|jgi:periplasmic divalent cation tolerance protein|nr:divalent-cation tolerance protein CutA [Actinospica sp.]